MTGAFLAWIGIGLAASLAAMIWPMRRGVSGLVLNIAAGVGGALILAIIGLAANLYTRADMSTSYLMAGVGAIVGLIAVHALVFFGPRGMRRA